MIYLRLQKYGIEHRFLWWRWWAQVL